MHKKNYQASKCKETAGYTSFGSSLALPFDFFPLRSFAIEWQFEWEAGEEGKLNDTYPKGENERKGEGQGLPLSSNITLEFSDPSVSKKILHYASARARPGRVVWAPNPKAPGYLIWQLSECTNSKNRPYVWDSEWDCQTYPHFHPQIIPYSTPPLSLRPRFLVLASLLPLAGSWLIESFLGNERERESS